MIIEEISIRGYKSFGNSEQVIKFNTQKGELVLLCGSNGSGKSSILECVEFALYGKVKSMKNKKWTKSALLPNRINGEMVNRIKFTTGGSEVEITRGISPNILKVVENGIEIDKAGKSSIDEKVEKMVGIDIETFKSFISLSINDFKNFISLSSEEKKLLLDKLFNLEVINILSEILKDLNKANKLNLVKIDAQITSLQESILSIQNSIKKALEREQESKINEIQTLNQEIENRKGDYAELKSKKEKISVKDQEITAKIDQEKEELFRVRGEVRRVTQEIDLYNSGQCPTCKTSFEGEYFTGLKDELLGKLGVLKELETQISSNISILGEKKQKLAQLSREVESSYNDLTFLLRGFKNQIDQLTQKMNLSSSSSESTQEFEKTLRELEDRKSMVVESGTVLSEKEIYYKELQKILGEDGIKKTIISRIIVPINHFLEENLSKMGVPFTVKLDENFNAEIMNFSQSIEQDSLSTGENKRINICIMIAYLKMIRTRRNINILFLDEVFSSIDSEGIESILVLLKDFAAGSGINIFVVHHAVMATEFFDRIISVSKDVFTQIEEISGQNSPNI